MNHLKVLYIEYSIVHRDIDKARLEMVLLTAGCIAKLQQRLGSLAGAQWFCFVEDKGQVFVKVKKTSVSSDNRTQKETAWEEIQRPLGH